MRYRQSRNLEASILNYIQELLNDPAEGWSGIRLEKSSAEVYKGNLPCILVNEANIVLMNKEIGNKEQRKFHLILIRIFATSDGQRMDLANWLTDKLETDINYYEYIIANGAVSNKELKGRIFIKRFIDNRKELLDMEGLAKEDKFRHLITIEVEIARS